MNKYRLPCFEMPISLAFPPVVICRGTKPSQAAISRVLSKPRPVPTAATSALAVVGPTPGLHQPPHVGIGVGHALISASSAATCDQPLVSQTLSWVTLRRQILKSPGDKLPMCGFLVKVQFEAACFQRLCRACRAGVKPGKISVPDCRDGLAPARSGMPCAYEMRAISISA